MSGSNPARGHTAYGKAQALRTIESDHRFNHHADDREVYHWDSDCRLCVEEHFAAKRNQESAGLSR